MTILREEVRALQSSLELVGRVSQPEWSTGPGARTSHAGGLDDDPTRLRPLVGRILDYLNERYTEHELGLGQVARSVDRSEKYVAHLFVVSVGVRMRAYITTLRLRRACELLLQSTRTIEQIASDSGFSHVTRFRDLFRRSVGVTPSQYRRVFAGGARMTRSEIRTGTAARKKAHH